MKFVHAHRFAGVMFSAILILIFAGCSGTNKPAATLKTIAVTPANPTLTSLTATQQFAATGTYSDNTTKDLTSQVTWASQTTTVATITAAGLATPVANGTSNITATLGSVSGSTMLTVAVPTLSSIAVTPANPSITSFTGTQQFTATGTYSDNSTKDLTSQVTWASQTTTVATISAAGLATPVASGTSKITATLGSVSGSTTLTVTLPTLVSIAVTPANPSVSLNVTQQFTATGTYSDTTTKNLTSQVTWASQTTTVATIAATGLATPVGGGTSKITATLGSVSGFTTMTVTVPTLTSIAVTPANPSVVAGFTQQFTATGTYSDTTTKNLTSQVTWASQTTSVATISSGGLATGVAAGTSTISATLGSVSGSTVLTVTAAILQSINISAPKLPVTIPIGGTADFVAVGNYSDGSTKTLTAPTLSWSSGTTATASINTANGIAIGLAVGTSTITATYGAFTAQTVLTVRAAASRFAYVGNSLQPDGSISMYAVNPATAALSPLGYLNDNTPNNGVGDPSQVVLEPSGRFAYSLDGYSGNTTAGTIGIYSVNPVTGALTPTTGVTNPVTDPGHQPIEGVVDPTGQFLYIVGTVAENFISSYKIDTGTGGLTFIADTTVGPTVAPLAAPTAVIVDHTGQWLYVIDNGTGGPGNVYAYSINASSGALLPLTVPSYTTGAGPVLAAIDPQNKYLYITDVADDTVTAFTINASNGSLTKIGVTFPVGPGPGAFQPLGIAVDPTSKYLYVANSNADSVSAFPINSDGSVGSALAGSPYSTSPTNALIGAAPYGVSVDPSGAFVAVVNNYSGNALAPGTTNSPGNVALFSIQSDGTLSRKGIVETRGSSFFTTFYAAAASPTIAPADVFAADSTPGNISAYTVTASTGALTPAAVPTVTGVGGNSFSFADVTGQFFYTVGNSGTTNSLAGFSVTQSSGALTPFSGVSFSLGTTVPTSVFAEPSDRFVYAAGKGANPSIYGFSLASNNLTPLAGTPVAVTNLNAITMDPQGLVLYGLGTNFVQIFNIKGSDGTIVTGTSLTATGTWTSGAVDASGQYLLALDSAAKQIQAFTIGAGVTFAAAGSPVSTGGTLPSNLVIDPLNRSVFVTDATANTITTFSFNPLTGAVAMVGTVTLTGSAGQAAVDATGTYLYVAVQGTPVTNPGSVAVFKISSTGTTLTPITSSPFAAGVGTTGVAVSNSIQ